MTTIVPPGETEFEVWANGCHNPPRVLLVISGGAEGPFRVLDPMKGNAQVYSAKEFLEVIDYLSEEDYERVAGRMMFEECDNDDDDDDDDDDDE